MVVQMITRVLLDPTKEQDFIKQYAKDAGWRNVVTTEEVVVFDASSPYSKLDAKYLPSEYVDMDEYDKCYATGEYIDQDCEECPHKGECSGYEGDGE